MLFFSRGRFSTFPLVCLVSNLAFAQQSLVVWWHTQFVKHDDPYNTLNSRHLPHPKWHHLPSTLPPIYSKNIFGHISISVGQHKNAQSSLQPWFCIVTKKNFLLILPLNPCQLWNSSLFVEFHKKIFFRFFPYSLSFWLAQITPFGGLLDVPSTRGDRELVWCKRALLWGVWDKSFTDLAQSLFCFFAYLCISRYYNRLSVKKK